MPYIGKSPEHGNFTELTDVSGSFDGSETDFALTSRIGAVAITPVVEAAILISINGVIQEPTTDYTVSGTTITFTSAPASTDLFFGIVMGRQLDVGTPSDSTVTPAKLNITSALLPASADGAALGSTSYEWSDLYLADAGAIYFGNDQEIFLTHDADTGLTLKHTATADDKPIVFSLKTGETDIAVNDVLGSIRWSAPDEGTGTDAILVSAAIDAISEGDFSSSNNATKLAFRTGASETATEKMALTSGGNLQLPTDATVLSFGADSDVSLTHVADTGLLLNSSMQLQFNDASQYIKGASATKMDIAATDEVQIDATLLDINSHVTIDSSTGPALQVTQSTAGENAARIIGSHASFTGNVVQPWSVIAAGSGFDFIECVANNGSEVPFRVTGDGVVSAQNGYRPMTRGGADLGYPAMEFNNLYLNDGGILYFGNDQEIQLLHVADEGLQFADSDKLMFGSSNDFKFYHDGTNSYVDNVTGAIYMRTNNTENAIVALANAAVTLYHDANARLATSAAGITVTGTVTATAGATLLIKNAAGSTLKTIKGMT